MFQTFSYKAKNAFIHLSIINKKETVKVSIAGKDYGEFKNLRAAKRKITEVLKNV